MTAAVLSLRTDEPVRTTLRDRRGGGWDPLP
jgi:hypothetical protein